MTKGDPAKLKKVSVSLPFGFRICGVGGRFNPATGSWALYVELVTRVADVQELASDAGLLREAIDISKIEMSKRSRVVK